MAPCGPIVESPASALDSEPDGQGRHKGDVGRAQSPEAMRSVPFAGTRGNFPETQVRPICRCFHATSFDREDVTTAEAGAGRFGEQALNDLLGLFVLALAKVMLPNPSARVEEVQRRSVGSTPATRPPTSQRRTFPRAQLQSPWPSSRQNVPDLIDSFSHVLHLRSVLRGVPRRKPATFRVPTVKRSISPPVTCEAI